MFIITNGMPRSGSTLVYNFSRYLMLAYCPRGSSLGAVDFKTYDGLRILFQGATKTNESTVIVAKAHNFYIEHDVLKYIFTYRNPLDTIASSFKVPNRKDRFQEEGFEIFVNEVVVAMNEYYFYRDRSDILCLRYEDMIKNIPDTIKKISSHMEIKADNNLINHIQLKCSVDEMKKISNDENLQECDKTTIIWPKHISDTNGEPGQGVRILEEEIKNQILERCEVWFKDNPDWIAY